MVWHFEILLRHLVAKKSHHSPPSLNFQQFPQIMTPNWLNQSKPDLYEPDSDLNLVRSKPCWVLAKTNLKLNFKEKKNDSKISRISDLE